MEAKEKRASTQALDMTLNVLFTSAIMCMVRTSNVCIVFSVERRRYIFLQCEPLKLPCRKKEEKLLKKLVHLLSNIFVPLEHFIRANVILGK